jgi:hypothetical protein
VAELSRLARTVRAWEAELLAFHVTSGCSNGATEAVNLLIKKVKRVGYGFCNFTNYRLRLLLHCGVIWQTHRTASLRSRSPRWVAESPAAGPAGSWAREFGAARRAEPDRPGGRLAVDLARLLLGHGDLVLEASQRSGWPDPRRPGGGQEL